MKNDKKAAKRNYLAKEIQQKLLKERLSGKLPVIDILGHPFYVDFRMEKLCPKDDFASEGIPFSAFDDNEVGEDIAWIPYNPKTHSIADFDMHNITEIPKDWVFVEIPMPIKLDPVGWARQGGWDIEDHVKDFPIKPDLKAKLISWRRAGIQGLIKENLERLQLPRKRINTSRLIDPRDDKKSKRKR